MIDVHKNIGLYKGILCVSCLLEASWFLSDMIIFEYK